MTGNDWAAVIAGASLMFAVLATGLGLIVRITIRWTRIETSLESIAQRISDVVSSGSSERAKLGERIDRVDARIDRHEAWHAERN